MDICVSGVVYLRVKTLRLRPLWGGLPYNWHTLDSGEESRRVVGWTSGMLITRMDFRGVDYLDGLPRCWHIIETRNPFGVDSPTLKYLESGEESRRGGLASWRVGMDILSFITMRMNMCLKSRVSVNIVITFEILRYRFQNMIGVILLKLI